MRQGAEHGASRNVKLVRAATEKEMDAKFQAYSKDESILRKIRQANNCCALSTWREEEALQPYCVVGHKRCINLPNTLRAPRPLPIAHHTPSSLSVSRG